MPPSVAAGQGLLLTSPAASKGGDLVGPQGDTCVSLNPSGGTLDPSLQWSANVISAHRFQAPAALIVEGFDAYLEGNIVNMPTFLWTADSSGRPVDPPARRGSGQPRGTGFVRTRFFPPIAIGSGQTFFIGYQAPASPSILRSVLRTGNTGTYFWGTTQPPANGPVATRRFAWLIYCDVPAQYATYGTGCAGSSGVPLLGSLGVPRLGMSFLVTLTGGRAASTYGLILGASRITWGTIPLPLDLGFFGAPNCRLLASFDLVMASGSTGTGNAAVNVVVPSSLHLVAQQFYNQFLVLDAGTNALNLVFSNGGAGTVGW